MKVETSIATLNEIFEEFSAAKVLLIATNYDELIQLYGTELSRMFEYARNAVEPQIQIGLPFFTHNQCVIHFSVSDLAINKQNKFNFHLQNTSQWVYAGAIVYNTKDQTFSSHH